MQRAELREREKREADALFFIVNKVTFLWALRRTLWTRFVIGWMGKWCIRYKNMAGRWRHCLFSFKARARSPKVKGVEKVWLINCSIEALDELFCERVVDLHSVEGHDECFSTHYFHLRLDSSETGRFFFLFVHFSVRLSWWNAPQKSLVILKLHPFPPGKGRAGTYYSLYAKSHPFFSKPSDLFRKNACFNSSQDIVSSVYCT